LVYQDIVAIAVWKISGAYLNLLSVVVIGYQIIIFSVPALLINGTYWEVGAPSILAICWLIWMCSR
jgi:hypothetical protein